MKNSMKLVMLFSLMLSLVFGSSGSFAAAKKTPSISAVEGYMMVLGKNEMGTYGTFTKIDSKKKMVTLYPSNQASTGLDDSEAMEFKLASVKQDTKNGKLSFNLATTDGYVSMKYTVAYDSKGNLITSIVDNMGEVYAKDGKTTKCKTFKDLEKAALKTDQFIRAAKAAAEQAKRDKEMAEKLKSEMTIENAIFNANYYLKTKDGSSPVSVSCSSVEKTMQSISVMYEVKNEGLQGFVITNAVPTVKETKNGVVYIAYKGTLYDINDRDTSLGENTVVVGFDNLSTIKSVEIDHTAYAAGLKANGMFPLFSEYFTLPSDDENNWIY